MKVHCRTNLDLLHEKWLDKLPAVPRGKGMTRFTIDLNIEAAAVLLRCLLHGGNAISPQDMKNGEGKLVQENISLIRKQVCAGLSRTIIAQKAKMHLHTGWLEELDD